MRLRGGIAPLLAALCAAGCAGGAASHGAAADPPSAPGGAGGPAAGRTYRAEYELRWRGAVIGAAREELARRPGGFRLERVESFTVERLGARVSRTLRVVIDTDGALEPQRIEVTGGVADGVAVRDGDAWRVSAGGLTRRARGMPLELLAARLARAGRDRFRGEVLLPGLGFASARAEVTPAGPRRRRLELWSTAGAATTWIELDRDGAVLHAIGPEVSAHRGRPAPVGAVPDLVAESAVAVSGAPAAGGEQVELEIATDRPPPQVALPGQAIAPTATGWRVRLGAAAGPAPPALVALVAEVAAEIEGDLSPGAGASAAEVASRRRADCTGHAVLLAARARARGMRARLVTGLLLDGDRLVRHVWAVVEAGGRAVPVDPTFGDAPVEPGRYLALAVHGARPDQVALAAELAYAGLADARARVIAPRSGRSTPRTP